MIQLSCVEQWTVAKAQKLSNHKCNVTFRIDLMLMYGIQAECLAILPMK